MCELGQEEFWDWNIGQLATLNRVVGWLIVLH